MEGWKDRCGSPCKAADPWVSTKRDLSTWLAAAAGLRALGIKAAILMRIKEKGAWADAAREGKALNWELKQMDSKESYFSGQGPPTSASAGILGKFMCPRQYLLAASLEGATGAEQHGSPGSCIPTALQQMVHAWFLLHQQKHLLFLDCTELLALTILSLQDFIATSTPCTGTKDRNSEPRAGAAGGSLCRNQGKEGRNLRVLRFKLQP